MRRKSPKFEACFVYDAMGVVRVLHLAVPADIDCVILLRRDVHKDEVHTCLIGEGQLGPPGGGTRYIVAQVKDFDAELTALKARALRFGATPEAIRQLGRVCPLTKEEVTTMAEKLKGKAKGNAEELKEAAKKAPVAPKKEAAPKKEKAPPNTSGLEKARAAKAAGNAERDKKKIKVLKKENPHREDSARHEQFETAKKSKTIGEYVAAGGKPKYLDRWAKDGLIEVS